ncbi:SPOR domain-containing protein [Maribacter sp. 2210JD10-5]|uniref:HU domain-containing protein n=1 Tax=Maribacter sp. 2210JD10-5 TaxID=3386272 RepID=UPI0039BD544C
MILEHYISDLLYRYNCVIVPNFGAFLAHQVSARINETSNTFFAPSKSLGFNEQLNSNDGLLVSHIAESEKITYEEALSRIEELVKDWKLKLASELKISLPSVGNLWNNEDGNIQFQPTEDINYLTSSFGLNTFHSIPVTREVLKEEVVALEEKIPFVISPEQRERNSFRPYLKYAAILLLALSTGLTGYRFYQEGLLTEQLANQEAQKQIHKEIQEATFFDTTPMELPTINVNAITSVKSKRATGMHHIVAGAFRIKANADRKILQLQKQGYSAAYYGTNAYGLHMVTYESHDNPKDALKSLREIKRTRSKDAWLLSEK